MLRHALAAALATTLAAALSSCAGRSSGGLALEAAPDFSLRSVDGRTVTLAGLRGRVVLIDVWATWCDACRDSAPFFEGLQSRYRSKGLVVLGGNEDAGSSDVAAFAKKFRLTYTLLLDPDKDLLRLFDVGAIPSTILLDRQGRVQARWSGFDADTGRRIEAAVVDVLEGRSP